MVMRVNIGIGLFKMAYQYQFNCSCGCSWDTRNPWLMTDYCDECGELVEAGDKKEVEDE